MKKKNLNEYGLDLKYKFRTYKNVGKDYGDSKTANRGLILNIKRFLRKNVFNKSEQRYKFCNTYSEWKEHVRNIIPKKICNYDDFVHWLTFEKKDAETLLETVKVILVPIYIAMLGVKELFPTDNVISTIEVIVAIAVFSNCIVYSKSKKVEFYEDFIEVVKAEVSLEGKEK